jgi:hypothetical protein
MNLNMKLNWTNSSPIKSWRPHGRKNVNFIFESKIFSILNMGLKLLKIIWAF